MHMNVWKGGWMCEARTAEFVFVDLYIRLLFSSIEKKREIEERFAFVSILFIIIIFGIFSSFVSLLSIRLSSVLFCLLIFLIFVRFH